MSRPKKNKKLRPSGKRRRPERSRGEILLRAQIERLERAARGKRHSELVPGREPGVVCEKCGFEQPYKLGSGCRRGEFLGVPCDGEYAVSADQFVVTLSDSTGLGDGEQQAAKSQDGEAPQLPSPSDDTR